MKKATLLACLLTAVLFIASCNNKKADKPAANADMPQQEEAAAADSTVYGECLEGSMHRVLVKMDNGRVMAFTKDLDDSVSVVFGGVLIGDDMAVTYYVDKANADTVATRIINLTTLRAHWQSLDRDFELEKGGAIKSNQPNETNPWTSWRILNGRLLLNKDTFDITMLSADSLYLENDNGIWEFSRVKEKPAK